LYCCSTFRNVKRPLAWSWVGTFLLQLINVTSGYSSRLYIIGAYNISNPHFVMVRYWEKAEFVAWTQKLTLAKCIRIYFACQLWKLPIPLSSLLFKLVFAFWFTSIASGNISVHSSSLPPTFRSTPQGCPVLSSPLLKLDSHSRTFRSSPIFLHVYNYLPALIFFFSHCILSDNPMCKSSLPYISPRRNNLHRLSSFRDDVFWEN
jgi:hypothetical protein